MTLLTVLGLVIFIAMGMWQLERAAFKQAIKTKFETRLNGDYQPFNDRKTLVDIEYRKLALSGRYDTSRSILVDNQILKGRAGYHVLTPFFLTGSDKMVLVNRGWVTLGKSREVLPLIEDPIEGNRVRGIASIPDTGGLRLTEVSLQSKWPQVVPYIDIDAMQAQFDNRLLPLVLWLAPEQPGTYQRHWNPAWEDPERSRAYAVQWFSFALIAFVLYFVLNLRKPE